MLSGISSADLPFEVKMISEPIRKMTQFHWITLFICISFAWIFLYFLSVPNELRLLSKIYGSNFLNEFCIITPDLGGFFQILCMWVLMSGAMMAPSALPAFAVYEELGDNVEIDLLRLLLGYLTIWVVFSFFASISQMILFIYGYLDILGQSTSDKLSGLLLFLAGLYQFTSLKEACLAKCRRPLTFFMQYFDQGPVANGLRLGAVCLGCCWALMLLSFVGGVMNLAFMGLATFLMMVEKLPQYGRFLTMPLGIILVLSGLNLFIF